MPNFSANHLTLYVTLAHTFGMCMFMYLSFDADHISVLCMHSSTLSLYACAHMYLWYLSLYILLQMHERDLLVCIYACMHESINYSSFHGVQFQCGIIL